ncbi:MAG: flavoprotein [Spirochaetales bacterium]|nr:flavoprotein [Spirochaetales bacterium]
MNVVVQLTGSIACYKAGTLISGLVKKGWEVQTVATPSALKFIGNATLEGLTDKPVLTDMFARGDGKIHISLAKWADLFVLYPATANTINTLAAGFAGELIGALFLANNFQKPYWIAPAMNVHMLEHPATRRSLEQLKEWGCYLFQTEEGILACKDYGKGRLIAPEKVLDKILEEFPS